MRRAALLLLVLAIPLAAGCGGDEDGGDGGDGGGQTIDVSAVDFRFDPAELTADAGDLTIALTNDGESPHAIEIEGGGVEEASDTINAGDSTDLTVSLEDGTYEIYCPVGDHRERGMVGTLTVGGGGAGAGGTTEDETNTGGNETPTGETDSETETDGDDSSGGGGGY
jgi:plastocyanin